MLLRCKLARRGGSIVTLGHGKEAREYHFKARDELKPDVDHVCNVTRKSDVETLLAIPEAYELVEVPASPQKPA